MSRGVVTQITKADSNMEDYNEILPHRLVIDISQSFERQDGNSPLNCIRKITPQFPAVFQRTKKFRLRPFLKALMDLDLNPGIVYYSFT